MSQEELQLADWSLVPDILKILEKDFPDSHAACRYLEFYASCKATVDGILLTPGGKVNKYGTFVLCVYEHKLAMFHSVNPDYKEIKSLLKSKIIPLDKTPVWGPIHEKFQPAFDEINEEANKSVVPIFHGHVYLMDINEAEKITYTCPPEVYLAPLKVEEAGFIHSLWTHKGGTSAELIKLMIELNGGLGLYLTESNELIAWCLIWLYKGPGRLFVIDQHRRKGYGSLVAKAVTKLLAEQGNQPACGIHKENLASQGLFKKIGYRQFFGIMYSSADFQK